MSRLTIADLHAELGGKPVLHRVSLAVGEGEFVGLIGPNGAGKTTLLRAILGLTPSRGSVALDGRSDLAAGERAKLISYLPQEREIAWPVAVERIVSLGRMPHLPALGTPGPLDHEAVADAMRRMEVDELAQRRATELSGGEKARVLIARALAQQAPLMLADEPAAGLDPAHQITLMRVFSGLAREGNSVIACLHDLGLAARWCTRLVLLDKGAVVADGAPRDVLNAETLRRIYGVTALLAEHEGGPVVLPLDLADDD